MAESFLTIGVPLIAIFILYAIFHKPTEDEKNETSGMNGTMGVVLFFILVVILGALFSS